MANEELIDEYISRSDFKSDTDFGIAEIGRLKAAYTELSNIKVGIGGAMSFSEISKGVQKAEDETKKLIKAQDQLAINASKAYNEQLKNARVLQEANDKTAQSTQKLIDKLEIKAKKAAEERVKNAPPEFTIKTGGEDDIANLKKTGEAVNDLDRAQAQAAISATEFGNSQNQSTRAVKEGNKEAQKTVLTQKDLALAKAEGKLLTERETAALKLQVREEIAVKGSLEQRRAALIRLNQVYDNQSPAERASGAGLRLQKIIGGLDTQVKTLESTTGRAQRNVGNYGSAFDKVKDGASKAFGALRGIANIIPGLGIAGLIGFLITPITNYIAKLFELTDAQKAYAKITEEAAKSGAAELAHLTVLKTKLTDITVPQSERIKYAKEYNTIADEGNKIDIAQINNLDLINTKIEKQIGLIKSRALAKAAENSLTEQAEKVIAAQIEVDRYKEYEDGKKLQELLKQNAVSESETNKENKKNNSDNLSNKNNLLKSTVLLNADILGGQKKYIEAKKKLNAEQSKLDRLANNLSPLFTTEADKVDAATGKSVKAISDRLSQTFERFKLEQNNLLELLKEGADDERSIYALRLRYLNVFNVEKKVLIEEQLKYDLAKIEEKRANDEKNLEAEKKKKGADVKGINREIATINYNADQAAKTAKLKSGLELEKVDKDSYAARKKLAEDFHKTKQDFADQEYEYNRLLNEKVQGLQTSRYEGMKKFFDKMNFSMKTLFLNSKYLSDNQKAGLEDLQKRMMSFLDTIQNYYTQISGVISSALDIGFTRRKNEVQDSIDAIEKQKEAELAANDARVQSEQDKAANIAIINSRAEQQKLQQQQRQKQIDRQQAQTHKALTIFQITLDIAKAVTKHLGSPWLIALDLALGAAQLAIAVATPIPKFFRGKKKGEPYSGPAIVNDHPDGRTMEVIERSDGSIEMPQGRNVLAQIGANDIIHPDKDAWIRTALRAAHRDVGAGMNFIHRDLDHGDTLGKILKQQTQQTALLKLTANKKELHLGSTDRGMTALWRYGSTQVQYVNENTNW